MISRRIGQAAIAAEAGVHITTVSLALRDSPRLPLNTRRRIQAIARKLNYQPDPMLSALTAYRRNSSIRYDQGTLAWVTHDDTDHTRYYLGAAERCKELGYRLETFVLQAALLARLARILVTRNIHGVLLAPQNRSKARLRLDYKHFSAITFGHSLVRPRLHMIGNAQYHSARICTRALLSRGYRRIGFISTKVTDERTDQNFSSGYLAEQRRFKESEKLPMLILNDNSLNQQLTDFREWYGRYTPDAIVSHYVHIHDFMVTLGISFERCALAYVDRLPKEELIAGIDQNYAVIGRTAVDLVVGMIHRNECGIPAHPANTLIEGVWHDGPSAPRKTLVHGRSE